MLRGTGVLATIGATAPFVGLFGTVWGIMNSFIGISKSQTTNLAVVAPGIAEALLATAFGLAAAIPAVVIYNVFARSIAGYRALLGDAAARGADGWSAATSSVPRRAARPRAERCPPRRMRHRASRMRRAVMSVRLDHGEDTSRRGPRDQRHAVHRRDAGAAHHLHGGGAACHRRHPGQPAGLERPAAAAAGQAALPDRENPT